MICLFEKEMDFKQQIKPQESLIVPDFLQFLSLAVHVILFFSLIISSFLFFLYLFLSLSSCLGDAIK